MKLFIVHGATGEYSDRGEWTVAAYADEAMAKAHIDAAGEWYRANNCFEARYDATFNNPFDPDMSVDYTGTHWYLGTVELRDALPTVDEPMVRESYTP